MTGVADMERGCPRCGAEVDVRIRGCRTCGWSNVHPFRYTYEEIESFAGKNKDIYPVRLLLDAIKEHERNSVSKQWGLLQ